MSSFPNDNTNNRIDGHLRVAPTDHYVEFRRDEIEQSIGARFEQQAHLYPNHLAVKDSDHAITYDALNRMANCVARAIRSKEHAKTEPVALVTNNDAPTFASILGILKAGRILVPLDPSLSARRAKFILEDTEAKIVVGNDKSFSLSEKWVGANQILVNIDRLRSEYSDADLGLDIPAGAHAHILYTSGSTGQPKGVLDVHRNVLHQMRRFANSSYISRLDRMAVLRPPSSSGALMNGFCALLNGASLFLANVREIGLISLANWLITEKITYLHSSATLFRNFAQLLTDEQQFPDLRLIKLSSGSVSKLDVDLFKRHFPKAVMMHVLSSTEAFTYRLYFVDSKTEIAGLAVPVGYPAEDMDVLVLGEDGNNIGFDAIGEIAVRSRYLFECYWKQPALTNSVLTSIAPETGLRLFKTGDLGRMRPDGCLEYVGRKDSQLKVRGHTIQPEEVELALLDAPEVLQAAVVGLSDATGDTRLIAYIVPSANHVTTITGLRSFLKERLPEYMLPGAFVILDALPLKEGGKVDRDALPVPGAARPPLEEAFVEPRTVVERIVARIWSDTLAISEIGVRDNFFDLGGDSIVSSKVLARVNEIFPAGVSMSEFFQHSTVETLTVLLESKPANAERLRRLPIS